MELLTKLATFIGLLFIVAIILALPAMLLWNWLMPVIFGLTRITFWQALGISILSGILFKGNTSSSKK